jgi:hypothetical protein
MLPSAWSPAQSPAPIPPRRQRMNVENLAGGKMMRSAVLSRILGVSGVE